MSALDPAGDSPDHAALMDRTYRFQRLIYDATRAWFLFGRDHLIRELAPPPGSAVLEIACGTGRNLDLIGRRYPGRALYGLDISSEMLRSARAKLGPRARLAQGDGCGFDAAALVGRARFDRVVLSFGVSMIPGWEQALDHAATLLVPGGSLHVVDFGMLEGYPAPARALLRGWLARFHVTQRPDLPAALQRSAARIGGTARTRPLYRGYAEWGTVQAP